MPSKKQFVAIAAILRELRKDSIVEGVPYLADNAIVAIADYYADSNDCFDRERFYRACGKGG